MYSYIYLKNNKLVQTTYAIMTIYATHFSNFTLVLLLVGSSTF